MAEHALLSPSSASRWLTCPGSVAMEKQFPSSTSEAAEDGTCCHEFAALAITDNKWVADRYIGKKATNGVVFTKVMAEWVQDYLDHLSEYAENNILLVEQRVDFSAFIGVRDSFGTSDAIIFTADGKELQVHDEKYGYHLVYAKKNPQMMIYALGALHCYPDYAAQVERVRLVIHQPSQNHLDEWDCSLQELIEFADYAKKRAANAIEALASTPGKWLVAEEKACQYCRAAATCPTLSMKVQNTIGASFEDLTNDPDLIALVSKDPVSLSQKMATTALIEHWIKAVRAEVERELLNGEHIPGYKLVQGKQGNRKWVDEGEVVKLFKDLKLSKDQIYEHFLISPTAAEKLFKIAPEKWEKVKPFITRSEGGKSVAPESDDRPAIHVTPIANSFENLLMEDLV